MPNAKGVYRSEWRNCDRCGFLHPITMLRRQKGLLLCQDHGCIDDLSIEYRPLQIQKVLAEPGEGSSETAEMFKDPGEYVEF
jgi:hypothetical protein